MVLAVCWKTCFGMTFRGGGGLPYRLRLMQGQGEHVWTLVSAPRKRLVRTVASQSQRSCGREQEAKEPRVSPNQCLREDSLVGSCEGKEGLG